MEPMKLMVIVTILISVFTLLLGVIGYLISLTFTDLKTSVDRLSKSVSGMNAVMASQQTDFDAFKGQDRDRQGVVDKRLDIHDKKIDNLDKDVAVIKSKIA